MRNKILESVESAVKAIETLRTEESLTFMEQAAAKIAECFSQGGKILVAGNGGSLCDAMHFAEEFTGYFRKKRPALPAIALADPGHISCVGNDSGFDDIFSRGVEAFGQPGDLFIGLTTSGNSENIYQASLKAKEKRLGTIAFLGKSGGKMKGECDLEWIIQGFPFSDRVQEAHMTAIHIIIEMVEQKLFYQQAKQKELAGVS